MNDPHARPDPPARAADVRAELEALSPELARLRAASASGEPPGPEHLARLASLALARERAAEASPGRRAPGPATRRAAPRLLRRARVAWAAAAAVIALAAATWLLPRGTSPALGSEHAVATPTTAAEPGEAIGSPLDDDLPAASGDPLVALLLGAEAWDAEEGDAFSPTEDVLLDWADDGYVEGELTEEELLGAVW